MDGGPDQVGGDPRRLPDQLRLQGPRDARSKSIASLTHALRMGDAIGADGVVLHPGSRAEGAAGRGARARRARRFARRWPSPRAAALLLENTAGARRHARAARFEELLELVEPRRRRRADRRLPRLVPHARQRLRHPHRRGARAGGRRLRRRSSASSASRCLHVNDSQAPLGSNRDRHADRSAPASWASRGCPRSCPSRASTACPRCSRSSAATGRRISSRSRSRSRCARGALLGAGAGPSAAPEAP